jgi:hypothetical protein
VALVFGADAGGAEEGNDMRDFVWCNTCLILFLSWCVEQVHAQLDKANEATARMCHDVPQLTLRAMTAEEYVRKTRLELRTCTDAFRSELNLLRYP